MPKYHLAPEPLFWSELKEEDAATFCARMGVANDEAGRALAYAQMKQHLRDKGQLCEDPAHKPDEYKIQ